MRILMTPKQPCKCIGCKSAVTPTEGGIYCANSKSIWYLYSTACRCALRESQSTCAETAAMVREENKYLFTGRVSPKI